MVHWLTPEHLAIGNDVITAQRAAVRSSSPEPGYDK